MNKSAKQVVELAGSRRSRAGRAFTLTELLLAVGALALLSVAVAQVFSLTSKTVQAGRRQSAINTKAAAIERQLRADLSSITREGFLVIRNQWTTFISDPNNPNPLTDLPGPSPLVAGDPAPRPRRIDELLFFSKGNFVSKREPVVSGEVVRADAAMIYYGHGSGQIPGVDGRDPTAPAGSGWNTPINLGDPNPISDGSALPVAPPHGFQAPFSPQRYAADWVLARREVLLTPASNQIRTPGTSGINPALVQDGPGQIGMQPAMDSVVNTSAFAFAPPVSFAGLAVQPGARALASGAVDIAGTTLAETRAQVLQVDVTSFSFGSPALDPRRLRISVPATPFGFFFSGELTAMQNRMNSALPAPWFGYSRMRVEPVAPNLMGWGWAGRPTTQRSSELERADQLMVSSGAFVPGCSEFIVEWSFGLENVAEPSIQTVFDGRLGGGARAARGPRTTPGDPGAVPANSVYWHGLRRDVRDLSNNIIARTVPYRDYYRRPVEDLPTAGSPNPYYQSLRDGYYYSLPVRLSNNRLRKVPHVVRPQVVESLEQFNFGNPTATPALYLATFGYIDPTWKPETRLTVGSGASARPVLTYDDDDDGNYEPNDGDLRAVDLVRDVNGNGQYDVEDGDVIKLNEPATMPWAWPRMIRVTFSIADPGKEGQNASEQTFQVIVNLPADQPATTN